jgi:hypothetical protein
MFKYLILFLVLIIISSCTTKKIGWESSTINFAFDSCFTSLKIDFNNDKNLILWYKLNEEKVTIQCSCTVDDLRIRLTQQEFIDKLSNKSIKQDLKNSSNICKEKLGNWYDKKG